MENKKAGAPQVKERDKKKSMTCSISPNVSDKAIRYFNNRGTAIELAVKYHAYILQQERERNIIN